MITDEQIKNLKAGDIVYLNHYPLTFKEVEDDLNTISAKDDASTCGEGALCWFTRQYLTVKPKHDPCRLFRKGDIVRLKEWNGRCPALPEDWKLDNGLFKVHEDEKFNSSVEITRENSKTVYIAPICFIELVTPVEELEPYHAEEYRWVWHVMYEKNGKKTSVCYFCKDIHPNAKAAAEAERDRLNAEWRKEQSNVAD